MLSESHAQKAQQWFRQSKSVVTRSPEFVNYCCYCSNTLCHNSLALSLHYTSHHTTPCMYLCTYVRRKMIKFLNKYCSYLRRFLRAQIKALTLLVDKTNSLCRFSFTITVLLRQCVYRMYPNSGGAAPPQPHNDCDTIKTVQGSC